MDTETNTIENESELVESSEPINENGCDDNGKPKIIETVKQQSDDKETDQSIELENDQKHSDDSESLPIKSPVNEPIILAASETEPYDIVDSENPSENSSPEKNSSATPATELEAVETKEIEATKGEVDAATAPVAVVTEATEMTATEVAPCNVSIPSVEVDDVDEPANDKNWSQVNASQLDNSLEKSDSDMACLIPSPSDPMNDSVNEKNDSWDRLNEPIDDANYDDSDDDDDSEGDGVGDDEFNKRSNPKTVEQKSNSDCQVFELTDDNSSVDDTRESDGDDDIEGDDMGEEEEEEEDDDDVSGKYHLFAVISVKKTISRQSGNVSN